jgi:phosphohistidine phosphatase
MDRLLLLLRHAKSSWDDDSLSDFDRPLNARGRATIPKIGEWLQEKDFWPELVLASSSRRTRETIDGLLEQRPPAEESSPRPPIGAASVHMVDGLYLASPAVLRQTIAHVEPAVVRLMVVGHNPGLEMLASDLAGRSLEMPTGCLVALEWDGTWDAVTMPESQGFHAPRLVDIFRPKEH